jgi:hypothetical protein
MLCSGCFALIISLDHLINPIKITIANAAMTNPEPRLIHCADRSFNLDRKMPVIDTRNSHQEDDPKNTPATIKSADKSPLFELPAPKPTKIAMNEKIVSGFVSVNTKVDVYAPINPRRPSVDDNSAGFDRNVLIPRYNKYAPPINRNHVCCAAKNCDTTVSPNAAIDPNIASAVAAPMPDANPIALP